MSLSAPTESSGDDDWEMHKAVIEDLYITQGQTRKFIEEYMKVNHDLDARYVIFEAVC